MQIVIDIPNKAYENIVKNEYDYGDMNVIIQNGIPLPKGHGRLIDADEVSKYVIIGNADLRKCPTIIEADKEERYEVN